MSWVAPRARGNPKKTKEISPLGVSSTEARTSSTAGGRSSTDRLLRCESAHRDGVADRERPRSEDVGVHGDTQLSGAAQRLEPGGRGGDAVLSQVDGAAALDPLDDREAD